MRRWCQVLDGRVEPGEQAVDIKEMARLLGVSASTIYVRARAGEVPPVRVGRLWRFFPSEVRSHLERAEREADPWARSARSRSARRRGDRRRQT